ncbi:MAG TPA: hypothetical protein PKI20_18640 [Verrucomicrobiota bacterium]|nr:hypothetical protein [Verrucomicrobiota bacterium]
MIERTQYLATIRERLQRFPVVSVLGPRQGGKTTQVTTRLPLIDVSVSR